MLVVSLQVTFMTSQTAYRETEDCEAEPANQFERCCKT